MTNLWQGFGMTKLFLIKTNKYDIRTTCSDIILSHAQNLFSILCFLLCDHCININRHNIRIISFFDDFVNYLTINVSEFYRNPEQWRLMDKEIIPELIGRFGKNLKVWSAACIYFPCTLPLSAAALFSIRRTNMISEQHALISYYHTLKIYSARRSYRN